MYSKRSTTFKQVAMDSRVCRYCELFRTGCGRVERRTGRCFSATPSAKTMLSKTHKRRDR